MTPPVAVIGSNSFSGATFVAHALQMGHSVIGFSRSPEPAAVMLPYRWTDASAFTFHQVDLNKDLDSLLATLRQHRPRWVFNFAAQSMVGQSWEHPDHWYQTNLVAISKLIAGLQELASLERYIHVSTPEVYGSTDGWTREHTRYAPSTPYAISRAAADMHLMAMHQFRQFPVLFTRAANVYGPGQQLYRIIPRTVLFIRLGHQLELHGGGVSERAFIHMDDVADATLRLAERGENAAIYHLSTPDSITIRKLVGLICRRMEVDFDRHVTVGPERLGKDSAYLLDSSLARETVDWTPAIPLEQGIDQVIAWVDQNLDALCQQPFDYRHKP